MIASLVGFGGTIYFLNQIPSMNPNIFYRQGKTLFEKSEGNPVALKQAKQSFLEAIGLSPYEVHYWYSFALVEDQLGASDQVQMALEKASVLGPFHVGYALRLLSLYVHRSQGSHSSAEKWVWDERAMALYKKLKFQHGMPNDSIQRKWMGLKGYHLLYDRVEKWL